MKQSGENHMVKRRGNGRKVVVVGLDGATFALIKPWAREGKLPHLGRVLRQGAHGALQSTIPPVTPPAWISSATGVNPGKHNIYGFFKPMRHRYSRTPYNASDVKAKKIWQILHAYGKRSGILHLPLTYPVDRFNGFMVAGIMTPDEATDFTHPPELLDELRRVIPDYRLNISLNSWKAGLLDEFYEESVRILHIQREETLYLMDHKPWDLFWVMFHHVDGVMHVYWKFMEERHPYYPGETRFKNAILDYYRQLDDLLGEILRRLDENTDLVILSDHGHEMIRKHVFLLNWLRDRGWLAVNERRASPLERAFRMVGLQRERLIKRLERWHLGWLPKLFPEALKNQVPRGVVTFKNIERRIDWTRTRAFMPSASAMAIWLNVRGREPQGVVEPGQHYRALREELIEQLRTFRDDETGEPILEAIYTPEEIYVGDYAGEAPDLLLLTRPGYYIHEGFGPRTLVYAGRRANERSGHHHMQGILLLYGQHIRRGVELRGARIIDVTPTILYMMGLPVQSYMDGHALTEAFEPTYVARHPVETDDIVAGEPPPQTMAYSPEEEQLVIERLKDMGYM
ncbi:MAG: hypothetical protein D6723_14750 [Acidobacteria bacterium]|nr:MAG: hypothetical protein D6723_14750 [Acidobacteriota bacterium]